MKTCLKCHKAYPTKNFYKCSKTKCGLVAKCKQCKNHEAKIYMRKTRMARRLKKLKLYDGVVSKIDFEKMSQQQLAALLYEVTRQFLYSGQSSRFCMDCESHHQLKHNK